MESSLSLGMNTEASLLRYRGIAAVFSCFVSILVCSIFLNL